MLRKLANGLLIVATIGMTGIYMMLALREQSVGEKLAAAHRQATDDAGVEIESNRLRIAVHRHAARLVEAKEHLTLALANCQSRDDFPIREGRWIAACRLPTSSSQSLSLACFVPSGNFSINTAIYNFDSPPHNSIDSVEKFLHCDPKHLERINSSHSLLTPDVFELTCRVTGELQNQRMQIELIGRDMLTASIISLPISESSARFYDALGPAMTLPSQWTIPTQSPSGPDRLAYQYGVSTSFDLCNLYFTLRDGEEYSSQVMRIWLASDVPARIPAIDVALRYQDLIQYGQSASLRVTQDFWDVFGSHDDAGAFPVPELFLQLP